MVLVENGFGTKSKPNLVQNYKKTLIEKCFYQGFQPIYSNSILTYYFTKTLAVLPPIFTKYKPFSTEIAVLSDDN